MVQQASLFAAGHSISLAAQIKCVKRELAMRHVVYPRRVLACHMSEAQAVLETGAMEAVLATLQALADDPRAALPDRPALSHPQANWLDKGSPDV
jgi:hypothetical protein